jgi:hypothetical protein
MTDLFYVVNYLVSYLCTNTISKYMRNGAKVRKWYVDNGTLERLHRNRVQSICIHKGRKRVNKDRIFSMSVGRLYRYLTVCCLSTDVRKQDFCKLKSV